MLKIQKRGLLALSACVGLFAIVSTRAQVEDVLQSSGFNASCDATLEVASGELIQDRWPDFASGAMGVAEGDWDALVVYRVRIELSDVVLTAARASVSSSDSGTICLESPHIVALTLPE